MTKPHPLNVKRKEDLKALLLSKQIGDVVSFREISELMELDARKSGRTLINNVARDLRQYGRTLSLPEARGYVVVSVDEADQRVDREDLKGEDGRDIGDKPNITARVKDV